MATTYGERLLDEAEERVRYRQRRRRFLLLLVPSLLIVGAATWQTVTIRHDALAGSGFIKHLFDHASVIGYATVIVAGPLYLAIGPAMRASAALLAAVTGPVLMPIWFGSGWSIWQRIAIIAICALVIAAKRSQPRPEPTMHRRGLRR